VEAKYKRLLSIAIPLSTFIGFLLGPGFIWEWRRTSFESTRLDIDKARISYETRQTMNGLLFEIIKLPLDSLERDKKIQDFNAAEKYLAQIENRMPTVYTFKPPSGKGTLSLKPGT
jgi:hypothetical protein